MAESEARRLKGIRETLSSLEWKDNAPPLPAGGRAATPDGYEVQVTWHLVDQSPGWAWDWGIFKLGEVIGGGLEHSLLGAQRAAAEAIHDHRKGPQPNA